MAAARREQFQLARGETGLPFGKRPPAGLDRPDYHVYTVPAFALHSHGLSKASLANTAGNLRHPHVPTRRTARSPIPHQASTQRIPGLLGSAASSSRPDMICDPRANPARGRRRGPAGRCSVVQLPASFCTPQGGAAWQHRPRNGSRTGLLRLGRQPDEELCVRQGRSREAAAPRGSVQRSQLGEPGDFASVKDYLHGVRPDQRVPRGAARAGGRQAHVLTGRELIL